MLRSACRFMLGLIIVAIVGGTTVQLAQSLRYFEPAAMADMPCDMTMPVADTAQGEPIAPCKGMTPDCIKQMGCVVNVALPARLASTDVRVLLSTVAYWSAWSEMAGLIREPEALPPRTA